MTRVLTAKPLPMQVGRKPNAVHDWPRMIDPRRRCAGVSFGISFKAFQNDNCSSGVMAMTCSLAGAHLAPGLRDSYRPHVVANAYVAQTGRFRQAPFAFIVKADHQGAGRLSRLNLSG